jgi:hypothetical protein
MLDTRSPAKALQPRHFQWAVKSVITSPSGGQKIPRRGYVEIKGIAWSGAGVIKKVEVSTDGGLSWKEARLQGPAHPKAHTRFTFDWNWDGQDAIIQSRATDETDDVQPTLADQAKDWGAPRRRRSSRFRAPFISLPSSHGRSPATGVCTMGCTSLNLIVSVIIPAAPATGLAQSPKFNVGTPLSQEEIKSFDFMIGPEGQALPPGHGTAKEGAAVFAKRCEGCHGQNGEKGVLRRLVLSKPGSPYRGPFGAGSKGQRRLLSVCDDRMGLHQPRNARSQIGIAHA